MKLPMKSSKLLLILLSISLVACLGDKAPDTSDTSDTSDTLVYDGVVGSAVEECDEQLASYSTFQQVYNDCIVWDGNNGKLVIKYRSDDTVTGLGLSIHYSSAQLNNLTINDLLETDLLASGGNERDNTDNDSDPSTDMVISYGWAALNSDWPREDPVNKGSGLAQIDLVTLEFTRADNSTEDYIINYTSSSNAAGYELILGK